MKGQVVIKAVRTSVSVHCGNPRNSSVACPYQRTNDTTHTCPDGADGMLERTTTHHRLIFRRLHPLPLSRLPQNLLRNRIILPIIPVREALLLQSVLFRYFVPAHTSVLVKRAP